MANVTTDIRVYKHKEMFSVDMAELLDSAILRSGVIQGCAITLTDGVLNIADGRIVINGRLGVIKNGSIPIADVDSIQTCWVVAVCDLSNEANPFSVEMVKSTKYEELQNTASNDGTFNVANGLAFITLGEATVDPATGLVTSWTANSNAVVGKGSDRYTELTELFKVHTYEWDNVTILSDGQAEQAAYAITHSGYRALFIGGWTCDLASSGGVNQNWVVPVRIRVFRTGSVDYLQYYFWNQHPTSSAKVHIKIPVVFVRDSVVQSF